MPHIAYRMTRPDRPPRPCLVVSGPHLGSLVRPASIPAPGMPPRRLFEVVDGEAAGRECWIDEEDVRPVAGREEDHRGQC